MNLQRVILMLGVPTPLTVLYLIKWKKKGLKPASAGNVATALIFDLSGLPPRVSEIDQFLEDESENAYEKVVDDLLQSSSYKERMASIWMDIARYADTNGYQDDTFDICGRGGIG